MVKKIPTTSCKLSFCIFRIILRNVVGNLTSSTMTLGINGREKPFANPSKFQKGRRRRARPHTTPPPPKKKKGENPTQEEEKTVEKKSQCIFRFIYFFLFLLSTFFDYAVPCQQ